MPDDPRVTRPDSHRPLSLHHLTMLDADPEELVRAAVAGGFDHAGLRIVSPDSGTPVGDLVGDPAARRRLKAVIADLPLGILDVEAVWIRADTDVARLAPVLDAAQDLGARHLLTVGHDSDRARLVDRFGQLADLAAGTGIRLALEPITYCGINDLTAARSLLDELGRDDVDILVDALQFFRSGVRLEDLSMAPRHLLRYAQIADGPTLAPVGIEALRHEARSSRAVPGTGEFDLHGWLRALPPGIPLAVEVPSPAVDALSRPEAAIMLRTAVERLLDEAA